MSQMRLVLLVAAFITLTGNFTFFEQAILIFPLEKNFLFVSSLIIWLFTFLSALLILACYRYTLKPILIFLLISSSIASYATNNYGIIINEHMIASIIETNAAETFDLFSIKLVIYVLLLGVTPSYFVAKTNIGRPSVQMQLKQRLKALVGVSLLCVLVIVSFSKDYTALARENRDLRYYVNPTYYLYAVAKYIDSQFEVAKVPFKQVGMDAQINHNDQTKRLVIMVIGETARADRFSLNGYDRDTNPNLAKESVVSFTNMSACGTNTALSLPCMFSMLSRDDYNHGEGKNMSNVLDIIKHAGVEVSWRENNTGAKGLADRLDFKDFNSSSINSICDIECRDEGMLSDLGVFVEARADKDILIVLHSMGSHGPAYYKRYPQAFEVFSPTCKTNQLNECSDEEINNAYDNSIVYTDYFLTKAISLLKNNSSGHAAALLYVSDHGESLGENGIYLHGLPYMVAPSEQTQVPAILWFNEAMSAVHNLDSIKEKSDDLLSHDNLSHTLLGIMGVETKVYDQSLDIMAK
ncbi:MAG: phosphoethanolamine--lipid A transferase [Gammaproteobacteria bacterium]|nr:phosphoethanolamine--lipid A transferase [Gammaproteobacteria bacterium]